MAVSLSRGDTVFETDAGANLLPASTMKLFTSALALDQLGPEHKFHTTVLRAGELGPDGILKGDLILQGGGDPAFTSRPAESDDPAPMDLLAELVRGSGVKAVTGNLIADPSAFDSRLVPDGWLDRYLNAPYAARVSALSLNANVASVVVAPGEEDEAPVALLDPPALTMTVQSVVRTVSGSRGANLTLRRVDELTLEAGGWIGDRATPRRLTLMVEDPANFTAGAFRSALSASGVEIGGRTLVASTPAKSQHVVDLPSPPLFALVTMMNRASLNHYAELIFRNAGRGSDGLLAGSADAGFLRLTDFLQTKVGVDPGSVYAVDGSGLSVLNRVTPRSLVQLLSHAHRASWGQVFHASLPVAGESATLRDRMRNTAAQGNLHAKTGTTSAVVSLSGYVTAENGELLAFAFIYNGPDRDRARGTIDQMGPALAAFARR
jgi:D-alanyl-D-alanine carboxypeptidase/D-alanyl-D-alanine-endopeptidase (penicillin-binding protein 4)